MKIVSKFQSSPRRASRAVFLAILAGLAPAGLWTATAQAPAAMVAPARQTLTGHVLPIVKQVSPIGALGATNVLHMAIGLPLRNQAALDQLIADLSDPSSPRYHQFLTPEEFTAQFGPTADDYQAVQAFAAAHHLTVTATSPNRVLLDVTGAASDVEEAFQISLKVYQHPTENRTFYAPDTEPSVPAGLPVADISGLNSYSRPYNHLKLPKPGQTNDSTPRTGSGLQGNYIGSDFRKAYIPGIDLTGTGQAVSLLQFDGYDPNDIISYNSMAGQPNVPLENVLIDNFNGLPTGSGGEVEVSLDIEMVNSMAPGLDKIILFMGNPDPAYFSPNDVLNAIAGADASRQISSSWGWNGGPTTTTDNIFKQMITQGQNYFDAVGDSDAFPPGFLDDPNNITVPSDNPYNTQVGGTTLTTTSSGGYKSETVWNWDITMNPVAYDGVGSSGGISTFYTIPTWQAGISMAKNGGSVSNRNTPDVALTADNVLVVADSGTLYPGTGGTSCAAPLWAGFLALANQKAVAAGQKTLGFINPAIYALALSSKYKTVFHDITTGNNTWTGSPTNFYAVKGYDLCTGLGTPNGPNMLAALVPVSCPPDGSLKLTITPPDGAVLVPGSNQVVTVQVDDGGAITNATVKGTSSVGATTIKFLDNGVAPDVSTNDGIYTAYVPIPTNATTLTLTVGANATNEIGATNTVTYTIIPVPGNTNFANAEKIPAAGGVFQSNNRFSTAVEAGNPVTNSFSGATGLLWWNYTATDTTNVLIDTLGSLINPILAVYTGNVVSNLTQVASATSSSSANDASVLLAATAGTTYRIAVASTDPSSVGSLTLRVIPGGVQDTNAPLVSVTAPLNGQWVSNNIIPISGASADDLQPGATGISRVMVIVNGACTLTAAGTTNWTSNAKLSVGINTIQVIAEDVAGNLSSPQTLQIRYVGAAVTNDMFANALPLAGTSGAVSTITTNATKEYGEPDHAGSAGGKSVWWYFTAPADGILTLSTSNSTFDTVMGLYTGSDVADLTTIAANDDAFLGAPGGFSRIDQAVRSGVTYYVAVDGYAGASGTAVLTYSFVPTTVYNVTVTGTVGGSVQLTGTNALGGTTIVPNASGDFAVNSTVTATAMPNNYYQFNSWTGSAESTENPLSLTVTGNLNVTANFGEYGFTDGFESGDLTALSWVTFGDEPWFVQTNVVAAGTYAARSGVIGNNQSSTLLLVTNFTAGTGSFDFRVSSETNFDIFTFTIDGTLYRKWSGEVGWARLTFPLTAGPHTLQWTYAKDPSLSVGLDAAFLDDLILPIDTSGGTNSGGGGNNNGGGGDNGRPPVTSASAAQLKLVSQAGAFTLNLIGQSNQVYIVQSSTDLVQWQDISTNTATNGTVQVPISSASGTGVFYRAVVAP